MKKILSMTPWNDKLHSEKTHKIKHLDYRFVDIPEDSDMLVATPKIFEDYISRIPRGESRTIKDMRNDLAKAYVANYTCPVTTGMFVRIVAEAAYEKYLAGSDVDEITPFWRVIDEKSSIVKKLSFDYSFIREQRLREGITG